MDLETNESVEAQTEALPPLTLNEVIVETMKLVEVARVGMSANDRLSVRAPLHRWRNATTGNKYDEFMGRMHKELFVVGLKSAGFEGPTCYFRLLPD